METFETLWDGGFTHHKSSGVVIMRIIIAATYGYIRREICIPNGNAPVPYPTCSFATGTVKLFDEMSDFAQPAQVHQSADLQSWIVRDPGRPIMYTPPPPHFSTYPTFTQYMHTLKAWEVELIQHSAMTQDS